MVYVHLRQSIRVCNEYRSNYHPDSSPVMFVTLSYLDSQPYCTFPDPAAYWASYITPTSALKPCSAQYNCYVSSKPLNLQVRSPKWKSCGFPSTPSCHPSPGHLSQADPHPHPHPQSHLISSPPSHFIRHHTYRCADVLECRRRTISNAPQG